MKTSILSLFLFTMTFFTPPASEAGHSPKMAICISKTSYELSGGVRNNALAWSALGHLSGIPYDCLFLSDLVDGRDLSQYDLIVLAQCSHVEDELYAPAADILQRYLSSPGHNVILDGPFAIFDESGSRRDHSRSDALFAVEYLGVRGDENFRIKVNSHAHYITAPFETRQFITQHVSGGIHIQKLTGENEPLLLFSDEKSAYPFLSCATRNGNRLVLLSDFSTRAGVASFFRNSAPQVYYANMLYEVLVRAVHWALYGDGTTPIPAPQLSNAELTAIIRLDADGSQNLEAQIRTIDFLTALARETGVVSVYGFVSDWAAESGWEHLAPLARKLEEYGGQIATHSKTHGVTRNRQWRDELDGSVDAIETNLKKYGGDIGDVDFFINPGNTIPFEHYGEIAKRFFFYMTHGGQVNTPLGYGNISWFTGAHQDLVVLNDVPAPDYQWFYDGSWSYTTAQITAYQEAIFDHMYANVGRGVVFNQMWHDYGITAIHDVEPPRTQDMRDSGSRIINRSNSALYQAMRAKFVTSDIYCPGPVDLTNKMRVMARWSYEWQLLDDGFEFHIDLSDAPLNELADYTGGMGLAVDNTSKYIREVNINGAPHFAFGDRRIILPNLTPGRNSIRVILGDYPPEVPRLLYVSKRMPAISSDGEDLEVELLTKSKARFAFFVKDPAVLLNADYQEWNRTGDFRLNGWVHSDRKVTLKRFPHSTFTIVRSSLRINNVEVQKSRIIMKLAPRDEEQRLCFRSTTTPSGIYLGTMQLEFVDRGVYYEVMAPKSEAPSELVIKF